MTRITGIGQALIKAGSRAAMARDLGVTRQAVQFWARQGYVPLSRIIEIEARYGIPRAELIDPTLLDHTELPKFDDLTDGE